MRPPVLVVRLCHWEHYQSAEDRQSTQRKGLVAVWNNRKTDRNRNAGQGLKERKRIENTGKREEKQRPRPGGRVDDNYRSLQTYKR